MSASYYPQEVHMIVLALVVGAAILLAVMVRHSYSREGAHRVRLGRRATHGGDAGWVFADGGSGGDCGAGDGGGSCGDGGGGGGGGD